jgi:hypothetical protein
MKSWFRVVTPLAAIALLLLLACGRPETKQDATAAPQPPPSDYQNPRCKGVPAAPFKTVVLKENVPAKKVDPDPVCVSSERREEVIWIAAGAADLEVVFKDSPFEPGGPQVYGVPKGRPTQSGPIRANASGPYHYIVRVKGSKDPIDPEIIVDP